MKRPLRFKFDGVEFLIPKENTGGYDKMKEEVIKASKENPLPKGNWNAGSLDASHINLLSELEDLGVLPRGFFMLPVVSGSYWYNWNKRGITYPEYRLGYGKPERGEMRYHEIEPHEKHMFFLTNWESRYRRE